MALMPNDDPAIVAIRVDLERDSPRIAAALGSGVETVICGALLQVDADLLSYRDMVEHVETMLRCGDVMLSRTLKGRRCLMRRKLVWPNGCMSAANRRRHAGAEPCGGVPGASRGFGRMR